MATIKEKFYRVNNCKHLLTGSLRGIERECLRVSEVGFISRKTHPKSLGSSLTHPYITTDFSESLLELITEPHANIKSLQQQLNAIHQYVVNHLDNELLWASSMPCQFDKESEIPIAQFGSSNIGKMKEIYRRGLANRYGQSMQIVAGVHFNYSLPEAMWAELRCHEHNLTTLLDYRTKGYFALQRNFKRYYWLLLYLTGASPVVDESFVRGKQHHLKSFQNHKNDYYLPYATSLRLSDWGYQSDVQNQLNIAYQDINEYVNGILSALRKPVKQYADIGLKNSNDQWQQLSTSVLQIENEYYSVIRPKQASRSGEAQLKALWDRGVEYIEVRCLDVNPFAITGIDDVELHFVEVFLLYCFLKPSDYLSVVEQSMIAENHKKVVERGREPKLILVDYQRHNKTEIPLQVWGQELLQDMQDIASMLDEAHNCTGYSESIATMLERVENSNLTPSAQILSDMQDKGLGHIEWNLQRSKENIRQIKQLIIRDEHNQQSCERYVNISLQKQKQLETESCTDFEQFRDAYFHQYEASNFI